MKLSSTNLAFDIDLGNDGSTSIDLDMGGSILGEQFEAQTYESLSSAESDQALTPGDAIQQGKDT